MAHSGFALISADTVLRGEIRDGREIVIFGYVEGTLAAEAVTIGEGGRFYGTLKAESARIEGEAQGEIFVKHLIDIRRSGRVLGKVEYGALAMEEGGELSAELRNVPPRLSGDLDLTVGRGRSVALTLLDLNAIDPDDAAGDLVFTVSHAANGHLVLSSNLHVPIERFTQADLEEGRVMFVHDGAKSPTAGFKVSVSDSKGATSGSAQSVRVSVRD